jgi:hypothetical protein
MGDFASDQRFRDYANDFASCGQACIGNRAHQPEAPATIDEADSARGKFTAHHARALDINRVCRRG